MERVNYIYPKARLCGIWPLASSVDGPWPILGTRTTVKLVLVIVASAVFAFILMAQGPDTSEYAVKAAFLFHFAQFVEWPSESLKAGNSPLVYCTIGDDPFHGTLDATLQGKTAGARSFRVLHLKPAQEIRGCQVLFIGGTEKKNLAIILGSAKANAILTVGESEHFVQEGGMIGFLLEENKIRFEVNLEAVQSANLRISSKLLALAKSVIGGQKGN